MGFMAPIRGGMLAVWWVREDNPPHGHCQECGGLAAPHPVLPILPIGCIEPLASGFIQVGEEIKQRYLPKPGK